MSETNPYAAPQTDPTTAQVGDGVLGQLGFKEVKKMYHRSSNVNVITFLLGLGMVAIAFSLNSVRYEGGDLWEGVGILLFYLAAVVGLFLRTAWGRVLGILVCVFALIGFPLGTVIGLAGLFAFFGAPGLFGSERVTHKELKTEYRLRKSSGRTL